MTYESLKSLPPVVAAGVAARAALSLHSSRELPTTTDIVDERIHRTNIISEIRKVLHLGSATDQDTLEVIVHHLYEYSDTLLNRLEETIAGLFTINTVVNTNKILTRRIRRENKIISKTVAYPTKAYKEFIGQKGGVMQFRCIFVREVEGPNPFFEIVVARQAGRSVHVSQCLRMYPNNNAKTILPEGQLHLLLKTMNDTITADSIASVLQTYLPLSTIIIIYSAHWVFSYYTGGDTQPTRDLAVILGDGFLDGFEPVRSTG